MMKKRKRQAFLASPEGVKNLRIKKLEFNLTYDEIAAQAQCLNKEIPVSKDTVRYLFNPHWRKRVGEEKINSIAKVLRLEFTDIVDLENVNIDEDNEVKNSVIEIGEIKVDESIDIIAEQLNKIAKKLKEVSGDINMKIEKITTGCTKIVISGSPEAIEELKRLYDSGELKDLVGFPIQSVTLDPDTQENLKKLTLAQYLSDDLDNLKQIEWKTITSVWEDFLFSDQYLAYAYRSDVSELTDEEKDFQDAYKALKQNPSDQEAIAKLLNLVATTEDENLRWKGIELLAQYSPQNSPQVIGLYKKLSLRLANYDLKLSIAFTPINETEFSIILKVYRENKEPLPPGLILQVFEESGELFDQFPNQEDIADDSKLEQIQGIVIFERGESFAVKVVVGNDSVTEFFVV